MNVFLVLGIIAYVLTGLWHGLYYVDATLGQLKDWRVAHGWSNITPASRRLAAHKAAWGIVGSVCLILLSPLWPVTMAVVWGRKAATHTKPFVADLFYREKENEGK